MHEPTSGSILLSNMTRPTNQEMFDWANNPPDHQLSGLVTSQEDFDELRIFAVDERRKFLITAARTEIEQRTPQGNDGEVAIEHITHKEVCFSEIPLRTVLSLEDCAAMSAFRKELTKDETEFSQRWLWGENEARRIWKDYATEFALQRGFGYAHSKYSSIKSEKKKSSEFWTRPDLLFHMGGITRIAEASLDLRYVELLLEEYDSGDRTIDAVPHPMAFWKGIIEEKRLYDEFYTTSYADVVEQMADGVFVAPYLDSTVAESEEFVNIDVFYETASKLGFSLKQSSADFTRILRALAPDYDGFGTYFQGDGRVIPKGAVFFRRELLPLAREVVGQFGRNSATIAVIDALIGDQDTNPEPDPDYLNIVFGTQTVSDEVAEILRSE